MFINENLETVEKNDIKSSAFQYHHSALITNILMIFSVMFPHLKKSHPLGEWTWDINSNPTTRWWYKQSHIEIIGRSEIFKSQKEQTS